MNLGELGNMSPEEEAAVLKQPWARGYRRHSMLRDLAEQKMSQNAIATKHGVTSGAMSLFARTPSNMVIIEEMRKNLEDKFAGIWIAQKEARILEYQQLVVDLEEALSGGADAALVRAKMIALKSVAEEMGQLPNRVTMESTTKSTIEVVGVNPEDVK